MVQSLHIEPKAGSGDTDSFYLDLSGLGAGTQFYNEFQLEIQMLPWEPIWTVKNSFLSNDMFYGENLNGTVVMTLMKHMVLDGARNIVMGTVRDHTTGKIYEITGDADGEPIVLVKDAKDVPPEGDPRGYVTNALFSDDIVQDSLIPARIDILVVWTNEAECLESGQGFFCNPSRGSANRMAAQVDALIKEANQVLQNSNTLVTLNLVHKERDRSGYVETTIIDDALMRLATKNDGYLDYIHDLR